MQPANQCAQSNPRVEVILFQINFTDNAVWKREFTESLQRANGFVAIKVGLAQNR
jgi:hypothetical protein